MSVNLKPVTITIISLGIPDTTKGLTRIKKGLHRAIVRGIKKCINAAIALGEIIIPESDPDSPAVDRPEGYSDESEALMDTWIAWMKAVIAAYKTIEKKLHDTYDIEQDWAASYAKEVNAMTGVNWTKATTREGFIKILDDYVRDNLQSFIHAELQKKDHGMALLYTVT